jgi:hypothetical protein
MLVKLASRSIYACVPEMQDAADDPHPNTALHPVLSLLYRHLRTPSDVIRPYQAHRSHSRTP